MCMNARNIFLIVTMIYEAFGLKYSQSVGSFHDAEEGRVLAESEQV